MNKRVFQNCAFLYSSKTSNDTEINTSYMVIQKKLFHKSEEKIQEKMKMILQKDENLVHIQQQYSVSFREKIDSKSGFF